MSTSAGTSEHPGKYKRSARNYLIDSRFQLKYTGYLVGVALVISGLTGSVIYATTRSMVEESARVVEESRKVSEESKKVSEVSRMNVKDLASDSPELLAEFNKEAAEYDKTVFDQQKAIAEQQLALIERQQRMVVSLVGGLALMVVLIGLFGIYFTHKVAGPIYKMKRLLKQVGQGHLRVESKLRKGDELHDFFGAFTQMVDGLRGMERKQLADVDLVIDAVEQGKKSEAVASLARLREGMRGTLDSD